MRVKISPLIWLIVRESVYQGKTYKSVIFLISLEHWIEQQRPPMRQDVQHSSIQHLKILVTLMGNQYKPILYLPMRMGNKPVPLLPLQLTSLQVEYQKTINLEMLLP